MRLESESQRAVGVALGALVSRASLVAEGQMESVRASAIVVAFDTDGVGALVLEDLSVEGATHLLLDLSGCLQ